MRHSRLIFVAAICAVAGVPAQAAAGGSYLAALATPLAAPRQEIVGGLLWKCAGERCSTQSDGSRAVLVCQRVVRAFGPVARFTSPAGELSSEELARCNGAG